MTNVYSNITKELECAVKIAVAGGGVNAAVVAIEKRSSLLRQSNLRLEEVPND